MTLKIVVDDLSGPQIAAVLRDHLADMYASTPAESVHALDLDALRVPTVTFWSAWVDDELVGCGAIKRLDATHAELKSMRTVGSRRRSGVASALLTHIVGAARSMGFTRLSLETGTGDFHAPARRLYEKFGFSYTMPFADYVEDPHSAFMTMEL